MREDIIAIMDNFPTPEFPYRANVLFPYELRNEQILKDNLSHIFNDLKELIEVQKLLDSDKRILGCLKFDSQIEKQLEIIQQHEKKMSEIDNRMNKEISPYCWVILKDFNDYFQGKYIKTDYLLVLDETRV